MQLDIRSWRTIDADYLNRVLALNEIEGRISRVRKSPVGTGQIGDCIRFSLDYATNAHDAPTSLVGKFPAEALDSRTAGIEFGIYNREVKFYQTLQSRARIATPSCYFAQIDEETHDFVLLMSDEAPAEQGDQLAGVTLPQAQEIARQAAKLHSAFWMDHNVQELDWIGPTPQTKAVFTAEAMRSIWPNFVERYGDKVSARARHLGNAIVRDFDRFLEMQSEFLTLVHVDFRPDNMLFATASGGKPLSVVDWQSISPGPAATDIGYCFAGALSSDLRRDHETDLLALYSDELEKLGAGPYERAALLRHYVLGAYQLFKTAFHSSLFVERTERGDAMFLKMLNGAVELIYDHQAEDWFV